MLKSLVVIKLQNNKNEKHKEIFFYVLLTMHLSIILPNDQLNAQILVL